MSEERPSSQRKTLSELAGVRRLKEAMANGYVPRERVISQREFREGQTTGISMERTTKLLEAAREQQNGMSYKLSPHDSASSLPSQGGKKETHTYKKKEYVVRIGEKGGRFILVGGKEKKKLYI